MTLAYIDPKTGHGLVQVYEMTSFIDGKKKIVKKRPTPLILLGKEGAKGMQKVWEKIAPAIIDKIKELAKEENKTVKTLDEIENEIKTKIANKENPFPIEAYIIDPRKLKELVKKAHDLAKKNGLEISFKYNSITGNEKTKAIMMSAEPKEYVDLLSKEELLGALQKIEFNSTKELEEVLKKLKGE